MDRIFNLVKIMNDTGGLIGVKSKYKVRNVDQLSYVYSPGVGACCMEIKNDVSRADILTNRTNSALVITDSSGFKNYNKETWVQEQVIPYIESKSAYYKVCAGVDTYPLIFDHKLTNSAQDLYDTLENLAITYRAIHLYKIDKERIIQLRKLIIEKKIEAFVVTEVETELIKSYLVENFLDKTVSVSQVVSCLIRVALDNRFHGFISKASIVSALERFRKANNPQNHDLLATLHLVDEFEKEIPHTQRLRKSYDLVKTYRLYKGEKMQPDSFDFTNSTINQSSIYIHERFRGMIETYPRLNITNLRDLDKILNKKCLNQAQKILREERLYADYITIRKNYSAIISNGTAVLGFGDIGPEAALPVMEGKCVLFKEFGRVNMMPMCFKEKDPDRFITLVHRVSPIFTSINLEDIKGPDCFKIERTLIKLCDPAIFHDDQHGTAIIVVAALINSLKLINKTPQEVKVVLSGSGAAGVSICRLIHLAGCQNITVCDSKGAIFKGRPYRMNPQKDEIAEFTNLEKIEGKLEDVIKGAHIFIGVSVAGALTQDMIRTMSDKPVIMALANPVPEIMPGPAKEAGAFIMCTGRSDFPNQVNNSLAFPGIFRAIRKYRISAVNDEMKLAAAKAIASMVTGDNLIPSRVIPFGLNADVPRLVAEVMRKKAFELNLIKPAPKETEFCLIKNKKELVEEDDQ